MSTRPEPLDAQDPGGLRRRRRAGQGGRTTPRSPPTTCWPPCSASEGIAVPVLARVGRRAAPLVATGSRSASATLPQAYGGEEPAIDRELRRRARARPTRQRTDMGDEYLSVEHLLLAMADRLGVAARRPARARCARCGAATGSPRRTPRSSTRPSRSTAGTSPTWPARASSTRSSAGTRRSAGSSRCCPGAPRTTRCSSASPASARPPSSRAWPTASSRATSPRACKDKRVIALDLGLHGGRRQVPGRVRGAAEGGAEGDHRRRGRGHHLHRRAAHHRRRRCGRRGHGRRQHDQADAGPRRAAPDRRHHPRRVPQAHREGRRPRAPVPAGVRAASRRWRTPSPSCAASRSATRSTTGSASRTPPWWPRRCCPTATSPAASCPTRPST